MFVDKVIEYGHITSLEYFGEVGSWDDIVCNELDSEAALKTI